MRDRECKAAPAMKTELRTFPDLPDISTSFDFHVENIFCTIIFIFSKTSQFHQNNIYIRIFYLTDDFFWLN
ncbi:MAG: hypothetical protein B6245_19720 [Desulfobacteraceae bacterium 4572_88]|nr:MAG: hypothetical protein B6245_19720 [Desulfobacteraceae bacterium 4572_88]